MEALAQDLQEARQLYRSGQHELAQKQYREILESDPDNLEALQVLGDIAHKNKQYDEARTFFQHAIRVAPNMAKLHNLLGLTEQADKRLGQALSCFEKAMELQPKLPEICNNLGSVHQATGNLEKAEYYYRLALENDGEMPEALNNLGFVLQIRGYPDKAIPLYQKALTKLPDNVIIHINLGKCYRLNRNYKKALDTLHQADAIAPKHPDILYSLGGVSLELGQWDEAEQYFLEAKKLIPDSVELVASMAYLAQKRGQYEQARDFIQPYFEKLEKNFNIALRYATLSHHTGEQEQAISWLTSLMNDSSMTHRQKQLLHFTMGKLHDSLGQYENAFKHYRSGNLMHTKSFPLNFLEKLVNHMILNLTKDTFTTLPHAQNNSTRPIFIVGMLRSGTSLVEQILASHPEVYGAGELIFIEDIAQAIPKLLGTKAAYPQCLPELTQAVVDEQAEQYLAQLAALDEASRYVCDKMPQNFFHLGLIQLLFPQARVIHCTRDPKDTCLSCYFHLFNGQQDYTYDLSSLGQYYRMYQKLMKHWKSVLDLPILDVSYETLVQNPETTIRSLLEFCQLPWDERCLHYYDTPREVLTSSAEAVKEPIYATSIGRHKHYDPWLKPLKQALGMTVKEDNKTESLKTQRKEARQLHEQGKLAEAEVKYRAILEAEPNDPEVLQLIGVLSYQQGKVQDAYGLIKQAIALCDDVPNFYNNLGLVCMALNKPDEAIANYKKTLALNPSSHEAHNNLAIVYQHQGKLIEAESNFQKALDLKPNYPDALNNLGSLKQSRGLITEAMQLYRQAMQLNPKYVEAMGNLGNCLRLLRKFKDALEIYTKAQTLRPTMPEIYYNIGQIQADMGKWEEAEASFKEAIKLRPHFVDATSGLAQLHEKRGEVQQAYELIQSIMDVGKTNTNLAVTFSTISRKLNRRDEAIDWMESLIQDSPITHSQEQLLHFNLGKLYDDIESYDKAFEHYKKGNQLQPSHFHRDRFAEELEILLQVFNQSTLETLPRSSVQTEKPIFIVGMMRSGTTLVEQILASHPLVHGGGELTLMNDIAHSISDNAKVKDTYPKSTLHITPGLIDAMAKLYLRHITELNPEAKYVTDKMPQNFYHLGLIQLMYPQAKVIHTVRHPLDTCLSCYFQLFNGAHDYAYDLGNLGYYYRQYETIMAHWKATLDMPILEIQYESLVRDFEDHARQIVEFCGLPWDDNCLRFYETKRDVKTASYQQVRQPIYHQSIERYRHYENHLGPLKEALVKFT